MCRKMGVQIFTGFFLYKYEYRDHESGFVNHSFSLTINLFLFYFIFFLHIDTHKNPLPS